jgi:hypothetical protein
MIEKPINKRPARLFEGDKIFLLMRNKNNDPIPVTNRVMSLPIVGIHASDSANINRENFVILP